MLFFFFVNLSYCFEYVYGYLMELKGKKKMVEIDNRAHKQKIVLKIAEHEPTLCVKMSGFEPILVQSMEKKTAFF